MNNPHYIGFDVHKKTISFCVKTAAGEIVEEGVVAAHRPALQQWAASRPLTYHGCPRICPVPGQHTPTSLLGHRVLGLNVYYVEYTVEQAPHMEIVQIVLDKKLLHAADQAAKRTRRNRSALVRDALREHLRRLELRASEERDRQGYSRQSQADLEARGWESEATWPEE
jgi:predicted transcriptional regulator